ncbi:MAG: helix-turn-helix domain-containing protein [Planktotalea sp.]|uniref:dCTP deaminase domain-containing protein n=1 Tax=Planktotalea sp. TaxID=2029877 RepID=UPI003C74CB2B
MSTVEQLHKPSKTSIGGLLRLEITKRDMSVNQFADAVGVSRQTLSAVLNNRLDVSKNVSEKLGLFLGEAPMRWYDLGRSKSPLEMPDSNTFLETAALVDHQIEAALDNGLITIDPFEATNLRQASYDLTLGPKVIDIVRSEELDWDRDRFQIKAGQVVNAITKERLSLYNKYLARVGATTNLARLGLIVSHGFRVDPGFDGQLQFSIFNPTATPVTILRTTPVLSIELHRLGVSPKRGFTQSMLAQDAALISNRRDALADALRDFVGGHLRASQAEDGTWNGCVESWPDMEVFAMPTREDVVDCLTRDIAELIRQGYDTQSVSMRITEQARDRLSRILVTSDDIGEIYSALDINVDEKDDMISAAWMEGKQSAHTVNVGQRRLSFILQGIEVAAFIDWILESKDLQKGQ